MIGRGSLGKKDSGEIFALNILKKKALIAKHQVDHANAEREMLRSLVFVGGARVWRRAERT